MQQLWVNDAVRLKVSIHYYYNISPFTPVLSPSWHVKNLINLFWRPVKPKLAVLNESNMDKQRWQNLMNKSLSMWVCNKPLCTGVCVCVCMFYCLRENMSKSNFWRKHAQFTNCNATFYLNCIIGFWHLQMLLKYCKGTISNLWIL